jgi:hypothetical protein
VVIVQAQIRVSDGSPDAGRPRDWRVAGALGVLLAAAVCASGCARTGAEGFGGSNNGNGNGGNGSENGNAAPNGGQLMLGGAGSGAGGASANNSGPLMIQPNAPSVTVVTGQAVPTVQFKAQLEGKPTNAAWSLDQGDLGTITTSGLFTPSGKVAGTGNVTAGAAGGVTASTPITVNLQTTQKGDPGWSAQLPPPGPGGYGGVGGDGPAGPPSDALMTALSGTPSADSSVRILYPYDGTVWPQGLLAPLLQWNPGSHSFDSAFLHIQGTNYEYKGYFAANKTPFVNLPIPESVWDSMTLSTGGGSVTVTRPFGEGGKAVGPYSEKWTIAQAALHGTIYYNSYGTILAQNSGTDGLDYYGKQYGAGTLAIALGATSPKLVAGVNSINPAGDGTGCRVCHTVSADGTRLVTQTSDVGALDYTGTVTIDLTNDTTGGAGTPLQTNDLAFPALSKDGTLLFSGAGFMYGDTSSQLYQLPAGTPVAGVTGLPQGLKAALPAFSPDTKHVSFNFWEGEFTGGATPLQADQSSLAIVDFDGAKTFSNPRILYTPANSTAGGQGRSVTFSSFLPSSAALVFELELANNSGDWGFTWHQNTGELWWADVASGQAQRLDQLNGYGTDGTTVVLPDNSAGMGTHTAAQDATLNYEPTVDPIASGGYAWVVFTSRRMYGGVAQIAPWTSDPRDYPWLDSVTDKKLWVAAVDLNATPGTDPSHPAFYLPGQELHAGNSRGYWSVDVCLQDGQSCQTGDQCCGGYCEDVDGGLVCTSQKPMCAALYDKCTTDSDCCTTQPGIHCVNMICEAPYNPPK